MKRQMLDQSHTFNSHCQPMAGELKKNKNLYITPISLNKTVTQFYLMSSLLYVLFHVQILSKMKFDCTIKSFHNRILDKDGSLLDPNGL